MTDESDLGAAVRSRRPTSLRVAIPLFRHEVLKARRDKALGDVLLVAPLPTRVLTAVALSLAAALLALVFWGQYTRKAHVTGYLVPTAGLIKLYPRETGTIVEKRVAEGQRVSKGDVLYVISMERRSSGSVDTQATAMAQLEQRRASLSSDMEHQENIAEIEERALRARVASLSAEREKLTLEMETQQQRVDVARASVERYRQMLVETLASQEMVEEKRKDLLEQQGKLLELQRNRITVSGEIDDLGSQLRSAALKAQSQRAAIGRDVSQLTQELTEYESRRTLVVEAPANGTATAVLAERGQVTNPSQPLVSILPENAELTVHLIVPSSSIGFLALNQKVAVRYQAFPYQQFGSYRARVAAISKTLIMPDDTALPVSLKEPAYRVVAALDSQVVTAYGEKFPLAAGMIVDADISLERRKLYQWILDPLYSVVGRV
jgi:membrane fusion protein